jgi:hypothetical protein
MIHVAGTRNGFRIMIRIQEGYPGVLHVGAPMPVTANTTRARPSGFGYSWWQAVPALDRLEPCVPALFGAHFLSVVTIFSRSAK